MLNKSKRLEESGLRMFINNLFTTATKLTNTRLSRELNDIIAHSNKNPHNGQAINKSIKNRFTVRWKQAF